MGQGECSDLEDLARLARLRASSVDCKSILDMREFLSGLSQAKELVEGMEPLYHVWEAQTSLREGQGTPYQGVDPAKLGVETRDGYVVYPWRGKR